MAPARGGAIPLIFGAVLSFFLFGGYAQWIVLAAADGAAPRRSASAKKRAARTRGPRKGNLAQQAGHRAAFLWPR